MINRKRCFSLGLPVPSSVIANETDERPLIKMSTATGARRPILQKSSDALSLFFLHTSIDDYL